ncbi:MAG: hypothetical protein II337_05415 [Clostridia bacterium]|nr:hypothetical protein [Clostridia bacterium]
MKKLLAVLMVFSLCSGLFCACTPQGITDTDSSVQASTDSQIEDTSTATDSATQSTEADTATSDTDSEGKTSSSVDDIESIVAAFPFVDTIFKVDWKSQGYKIPVKNNYTVYATPSSDDSASSDAKEKIKLNLQGKVTLIEGAFHFSGEGKPATFEALSGKQAISLTLPKYEEAFTLEYKQTSHSGGIDSPYEVIRKTSSNDLYKVKTSQGFNVSLLVQRETGVLTQLFFTSAPQEWFIGDTTQEEAVTMARNLLEQYYGKDALTDYSYTRTSVIDDLGPKDSTYCIVYTRMLGNYPTSEVLKFYITKGGYFTGVSTFNYGLFADLEDTLTVERVEATEKDVRDLFPGTDLYDWKIDRDLTGEYYLSFFCEDKARTFEYDLTINIK